MIELALDAAAAYRLTRLVTADVILDRPRAYVIRTAYSWRDGGLHSGESDEHPLYWNEKATDDDEAPKLAELVVCRWCVGVWISGFVVTARRYYPGIWDPIARVLATSAAAALLARLEDE